jgi:4-amino-4-deoxy-L-arabinose transferase-like glycosyltransferase
MINKLIYFFKTLNEKQILLILLGMTFALRLYAVLMAQGIANDSVVYGFVARDFLRGQLIKGLSSPAPPFYPFLISLFSIQTTYIEMTGRLFSLFFGTMIVLPLYYLVKEAIGQREAIFSTLFCSFHPYLVTYSGMFLTEVTYGGLLILSIYLFWTGLKKEKIWRMMLSGFFLSLTYLTRPEGIGYVLIYLIWIGVEGGLKRKWFKKLILMGSLVLIIFIFVSPYILYIHQETGQWLISKKAMETQSQFFKKSEGEVDPSRGVGQNKPVKEKSKIQNLSQTVIRFFPFVTYHYLRAYHFSLWLFLFFGLIRVRRKVIAYELFLASLVLFHLFSLSILTSSTIRFSVPFIPLSLFWAGAGILEMKRYLEKIKISNPEKVIFLFIVLVILIQLPQGLKPERRHRAEQKEVGLWLKQNTPPDAIIMSNSPQEAFYAERELILLPMGIAAFGSPGKSYHEIIDDAKTKGVQYLLVDKNTHETNPGFIESIRSTDLKEIFRNADRTVMIYRVIY